MSKVVDLSSRKKVQQEEAQEQTLSLLQIPKEYEHLRDPLQQQLTSDMNHVRGMSEAVNEALLDYAKKSNENGEMLPINLPMQACTSMLTYFVEQLDISMIGERKIAERIPFREELATHIMNSSFEFIQNKKVVHPQDVYAALALVLMSELTQNRLYSIVNMLESENRNEGETDGESK